MFKNIGGKIKGLAKFICWVGIIVSIIIGVAMIAGANQSNGLNTYTNNSMIVGGILVIVFGILASWVGSFTLYGFGELVDNSSKLAGTKKD